MMQTMALLQISLFAGMANANKHAFTFIFNLNSRYVSSVVFYCSFEDFGLNASLTSTLSKLYNDDIDQVEWFVGLMMESPAMGASFLAETMVSAVATFAISAIWNTDLVKNPLLWTSQRMTAAGKAWVEATTFQDILGVNLEMPFFTPDRQPDWHTVDAQGNGSSPTCAILWAETMPFRHSFPLGETFTCCSTPHSCQLWVSYWCLSSSTAFGHA